DAERFGDPCKIGRAEADHLVVAGFRGMSFRQLADIGQPLAGSNAKDRARRQLADALRSMNPTNSQCRPPFVLPVAAACQPVAARPSTTRRLISLAAGRWSRG